MRLSCQKACLVLFVATIGCRDATAALKLPAQFELVNINGRPVPTFFSPTPGLTPTILSASLTLDNAGKAVMIEHRREFDGTETTKTNTLDYRIKGNQLEISCFQPPTVGPAPIDYLCAASYTGTISGETLGLIIVPGSINSSVIYNYRIEPTL